MKAILFDVDDTLYDQIVPFEETYQALFGGCYQISCSELFVASRKHSDVVYEKFQNDEISAEDMYSYRISKAFADFGIKVSRQLALDFQALYEQKQKQIKMTEPVEQILDTLKAQQIKLGVITNGGSEHQRNKIKSLRLERFISPEYMFVSGDHEFVKPDPRIFQYAEQVMGLDKQETWFVGDSFENDVVGAKMAGWNCIWFNRRNHLRESADTVPDFMVEGEASLSHLLLKLIDI